MNEFIEAVSLLEPGVDKIDAEVSFDEFNLEIDLVHDGEPMQFPMARPADAELLEDERAVARLAGFLIRNYVDRVKSEPNQWPMPGSISSRALRGGSLSFQPRCSRDVKDRYEIIHEKISRVWSNRSIKN